MTMLDAGSRVLCCDYCGIEFVRCLSKVNPTKNYCSSDCRNRDMREVEICDYCGEPFVKTKSKVNKEKYYCSKECHFKDDFQTLTCDYCGKEFVRANFRKRCSVNYCSKKCSVLAHRGKTHEVTIKCDWCGREIIRDECFVKRVEHHYCSIECRGAWQKEFQVGLSGDKNPNWKGGSTPRLGICQWTISVLERDNYTCVECGSTQHPMAHHIIPWSENKDLRFDINNGITLCPRCHSEKHPEHKALIMYTFNKTNKQKCDKDR